MATVLAEKMTKAQAATTMGGSRESLPDFQPVAGLMVELQLSEQEQVHMREEIHQIATNFSNYTSFRSPAKSSRVEALATGSIAG